MQTQESSSRGSGTPGDKKQPTTGLVPAPTPTRPRRVNWFADVYGRAVGKKYVMAITGIVLMGFVLVHMIGNLKLYLGAEKLNHYSEWLRTIGEPIFPHSVFLWIFRATLLGAVGLHVHSAYGLTRINWDARGGGYQSKRDYVAANFASRTMRWTGIIVGLFVVFHLMDLTWGNANPDYVRGEVFANVVASFQRVPVAVAYVVANLALGLHLFHGVWSLFQSMGWNHPRFNPWRRWLAVGFAAVVTLGNISFPIMVQLGVID